LLLTFSGAGGSNVSNVALLLQGQRAGDGRLRPAANRVRLEVLLGDEPSVTQIGPNAGYVSAFDCQRWRAGKATAGHQPGTDAGHRSPARAVLNHGRIVNAAHHRQAWAVVFSDAQCVAGLVLVEAKAPGGNGGAAQSVPGARGMIVAGGGVQSQAGA